MQPPFRAEHIGSFVRPARLVEAARAHKAGKLDDAGFRAAQDEAIRVLRREGEVVHRGDHRQPVARAQPGTLNFGSSGIGGNNHFSGALFDLAAGTKMIHVPYKGISLAMTAVGLASRNQP